MNSQQRLYDCNRYFSRALETNLFDKNPTWEVIVKMKTKFIAEMYVDIHKKVTITFIHIYDRFRDITRSLS